MWFIHFGWKYSKSKHDKVIASCDPPLRTSDKTALNHLRYLNIPLHDYKYEKDEKKKLQTIRNLKQQRAKELDQPKDFTTEIEPDLVSIVARHIEMTLQKEEYPWNDPLIKDPTQELIDLGEIPINEPGWYTQKQGSGNASDQGAGRSMRRPRNGHARGHSLMTSRLGGGGLGSSKKKSNAFGSNMNLDSVANKNKRALSSSEKKEDEQLIDVCDSLFEFEGSRVIVCVFGGVTYAELKGLYDLMRKTKKEIIVCATDVLTSSKFLDVLSKMGGDDVHGSDDESDNEESNVDSINLDMGDFLDQ